MQFARTIALSIAVLFVVGGCATSEDYHAQHAGAPDGYSEQRLSETEWRVEYVGNAETSHEMVESHLLHRAAELTVASGFDWFAPSDASAAPEAEVVIEAAPRRSQSPVWRPMWRHRNRLAWSDWMVRGAPADDPAATSPSRPVDGYAAREDISMGRGEAPEGAFDARAVLTQHATP